MPRPKIKNELLVRRCERGLSRKQAAKLLGKSESAIRRLEQGCLRPSFDTALQLEILYRRPVAYLYSKHYQELRKRLRAQEGGRPW